MSDDYCNYIIDMLAPWAPVNARKMFGGYGFYRSGLMFGIYTGEEVYFKVNSTNQADYEAVGSAPFTFEAKGRRTTTSYWLVPAEVLDDESALCAWAEKAYAVACLARSDKHRAVAVTAAATKKKPAKRASKTSG